MKNIRLIKRFYKYYTKEDLDDNHDIIKLINNEEFSETKINEDFKFINDKNTITDIIITFTNNIIDLYSIFENINKDFIEKLKPYREQLIINDINNTNQKASLSFDKEDILKNMKNPKLTYAERILYGLFMLVEPIKYDILRSIKTNQIKDNKINIAIGELQRNTKILDIPKEVVDIINMDKEYLLGMKYTQSGVSKMFKNSFQKVYGISYSIVEIRNKK